MKDRIRILYVTDGLGNGGKERQLIETLKHLDREKFTPGLITFSDNQHYTRTAEELSGFFRIIPKEKSNLEPVFSIFDSFEKFRPHVVHSFDIISAFYSFMPSVLYKSRIVNATIQDAGLDKGWQRRLKIALIKRADMTIGNSFKGLNSYGVSGEVLYNFIDESRFHKPNRSERFHAAMVANFSIYKDYDAYFRVVKRLLDENLIDDAYAIGSGNRAEEYKRTVMGFEPEIRDRIVFTGNTNIVEEILSSISVGFLFSTDEYGEGISNSVLEYMASGVIPIVSDIGASDEIIKDGINGFLVDKNDTDGIADIVRRLKNENGLSDKLRERALETIKEKFSLSANIRKLEGIYLKLTGE